MTPYSWMSGKDYVQFFKKMYVIDPNFGFRPILDTEFRNAYGTLHNHYSIEKRDGVRRLLFIGDSVTVAGSIVRGLQSAYGEEAYEYWNAGVGSYNTAQEVNYYMRYNSNIHPDEVILTFVYNDFDVTPIAFYNSSDLVVYSPNKEIHNLSPNLFKASYLYRRYISLLMSLSNYATEDNTEVEKNLKKLRDELAVKNIQFTVIISPWLKASESLTQYDKNLHTKIVSILTKLRIRFFDISSTTIVDESIKDGVVLSDPIENDTIHPSQEVGNRIAQYLHNNNFFQAVYE